MTLTDRILGEMEAASVAPDKPLVIVDADEVLVHFAGDFGPWCERRGITFSLQEYRLDTALRHANGTPLTRAEIEPLIHEFIDAETATQRAIDGAAEALEGLSREAQVVVLTNAPLHVRALRVANLTGHGMDYPVIMNEGGKGRAIDWLHGRAAAPAAFVDDSHAQHVSARKHAAEVTRLHLVGSDVVRGVIGPSEAAHHHPEHWGDCVTLIRRALHL